MPTTNKSHAFSGKGYDPTEGGVPTEGEDTIAERTVQAMLLSTTLCHDAQIIEDYDEVQKDCGWHRRSGDNQSVAE